MYRLHAKVLEEKLRGDPRQKRWGGTLIFVGVVLVGMASGVGSDGSWTRILALAIVLVPLLVLGNWLYNQSVSTDFLGHLTWIGRDGVGTAVRADGSIVCYDNTGPAPHGAVPWIWGKGMWPSYQATIAAARALH
jgi:hypothetical protein